MARYGIYDNITESKITSATSSIREKINKIKTNISETQSALSDSVWKAGAKATLFTAFTTIDGEVCADILSYLDNLDTIAGHISNHKTAEQTAKGYSNRISTNNSQETNNNLRSLISEQERIMTNIENEINSLKNG